MPYILLAAINAKWIHPSLALRLLKANLGEWEDHCEIVEFALRQPMKEKVDLVIAACPRILGLSVSIWNHIATMELLRELSACWTSRTETQRPIVVIGGPEVSHLPDTAEIFQYAGFVIRGEGETAFRELCGRILGKASQNPHTEQNLINLRSSPVNLSGIKSAYHLYTEEDLCKKLTYVEASRGCPFNCGFCLSAIKPEQPGAANPVREFPLETFLAEMEQLVHRGGRTFKFLDRTFNLNIPRARRIMEFFLEKIEERQKHKTAAAPFGHSLTVHFEMAPSLFPPELRKTIARFPPGSLRIEIGIQTLNAEVSRCIGRLSNPEQELETLRFLKEKTDAIIHADLIAGLPGEDLASFGSGFNLLWTALAGNREPRAIQRTEIQLGILKLLPGTPIACNSQRLGIRGSIAPPYETIETSALSEQDLNRIKNFARFWELIVNRGLLETAAFDHLAGGIFEGFMALSDTLLGQFGRNWGIAKHELREAAHNAILNP